MASFLDNLELGIAGVTDAAEHAAADATGGIIGDSQAHSAADLYTEQESQDESLTVDESAALRTYAQQAEATQDVLGRAAKKTVNDLAAQATTFGKWLPWIAGGAAALIGAVALAVLSTNARAAAKAVGT